VTTLRAYPALIRAAVQETLTYRGRLLWMFIGMLFPLLLMFVWLTVVEGGEVSGGWTSSDLASYYVAAALVYQLVDSRISWLWNADLRSGALSARLLRPVPVFHQYGAIELGTSLVALAIVGPLVLAATLTVPLVTYHPGFGDGALAVVAVGLAFVLGVLMASTFALVGFWTTQSGNLYLLWWGVGSFLSGWVAPRELTPSWLAATATVLPFRYSLGFPIELALGRLDGRQATVGLVAATAWIVVFSALYRKLWRLGVRHHQAVGG
jgi:ABC-2 type transport system permease protein